MHSQGFVFQIVLSVYDDTNIAIFIALLKLEFPFSAVRAFFLRLYYDDINIAIFVASQIPLKSILLKKDNN